MADASPRLTNPGGKLTLDRDDRRRDVPLDGRLHERSLYHVGRRDRCPPEHDDAATYRAYGLSGGRAGFDMVLQLRQSAQSELRGACAARPHARTEHYRQNELFYGSVYATGSATIRGNKNGVSMDIVVALGLRSTFPAVGQQRVRYLGSRLHCFRGSGQAGCRRQPSERFAPETVPFAPDGPREFPVGYGHQDGARHLAQRRDAADADQAGDNVLRGRGNGTLNLHVNPVDKEFTIYGDYDITEGSYRSSLQNFATRNFLIQEEATFSGRAIRPTRW